jgi:hypothetical protein
MSGCAMRSGPKTIARARFDYSTAINSSWKEQTLLNLVRVRYADSPTLLDVQQVVAQYTFDRSASINSTDWNGNPSGIAGSITGRWAESPTITYTPMSGEKFTKSLLRPVEPANLFALVQAGWPIDAVFGVGVKAINGLEAGSQVELFKSTGDADFYRVLTLLRELQETNEFGLRVEEKPGTVIVVLRSRKLDPAMSAAAREVKQMLHLNRDAEEFKLSVGAVAVNDKEVAMLTRSMMEIMVEISAGVDIPDSDIQEGRATKMGTGGAAAKLGANVRLRVHSSATKPSSDEAFATVHYRNHWFWVDDRDLNSKRGLGFLMVLFTLAESGPPPVPPVLSLTKP